MISRFIKGKTYVFIDASNIFYSQQTLKWKVDYKKFKKYLEKETNLEKIYFYSGKVGDNLKQNNFLNKLKNLGYIVKVKEVKVIKVSSGVYEKKGNLDIELAVDLIKNINKFNSCILVSGDSDFAVLVDEMKKLKKRVVVLSTRGHISRELIERAKYIDLRKLKYKISYKKQNPSKLEGNLE
ncbi:NYN domain-containing protein [Candidatus Parcubacteria bacterium]|nr:NYN domain-containing protein [Candidatus Parcubacteria bacterium]